MQSTAAPVAATKFVVSSAIGGESDPDLTGSFTERVIEGDFDDVGSLNDFLAFVAGTRGPGPLGLHKAQARFLAQALRVPSAIRHVDVAAMKERGI